jgi:hypothetical protein
MKDNASEVKEYRPEVQLGLGLPEDNAEKATGVASARGASVMSKRTAIRTLHPDWTEDQVEEELEDLEDEGSSDPAMLAIAAKAKEVEGDDEEDESDSGTQGGSQGSSFVRNANNDRSSTL